MLKRGPLWCQKGTLTFTMNYYCTVSASTGNMNGYDWALFFAWCQSWTINNSDSSNWGYMVHAQYMQHIAAGIRCRHKTKAKTRRDWHWLDSLYLLYRKNTMTPTTEMTVVAPISSAVHWKETKDKHCTLFSHCYVLIYFNTFAFKRVNVAWWKIYASEGR